MLSQSLAAALIAGLPVFASAAGQPTAATGNPHSSSSAHANAVAGQANAARIEACTIAANKLLDNLDKGNAKAATANFNATMQANLSAAKLAEAWRQVTLRMGSLQSRGTPQNAIYQDHTFATVPLHFKNVELNAQVVCDTDGKIAGFFLRPSSSVP